jgi:hypothetical protein
MRDPIFSRGSATGDAWSDIAHPTLPRNPFEIRWRLMTSPRWKGPTRANIAQLSVAHAHTPPFQGNPFGVTWRLMTSHPVSMLRPVMRNGTFYTTIIRRKRGNLLRMRTRSLPVNPVPVTWFRWGHFWSGLLAVTSLPVAPPPQMRLWLCWYTTGKFWCKVLFTNTLCM